MAWMLTHYGDPQTHIAELIPIMNAKGIHLIEAEYSGGNDSGCVESVTAYDGAKTEIPVGRPSYGHNAEQSPEDDKIWELCNAILSTKYGSWAGEFSAQGTLYVNLEERRCWMDGTETVDQHVAVEDAINVEF